MSDSIAGMLFGVSIIFIPILLFFMVGVGIDCFKPEDWLNNYAENKKNSQRAWNHVNRIVGARLHIFD